MSLLFFWWLNLKILLHGINFSPELTGIGKYTGDMALWLIEHGHDVRVVTAPPYYPAWKVRKGYRTCWYSAASVVLNRGSFAVIRCPLWVPSRPSGLKRLIHLFSFALSSLPVMLGSVFWRPDVVWVVEPPLFCAPQAAFVAWLSRAKSWLHVQDFEVDAAFELGLLRHAGLRRLASGFERWIMGRFDRVSSISPNMVQRLRDKGVDDERVVLLPNWVDIRSVVPRGLGEMTGYRHELGIGEEVVALYSGNMGAKQGLEVLADVAARLRDDRGIVLILCGDGALAAELAGCCRALPNVRLLPLQPLERLDELLNTADIHLLPQRADAADLVMPSKLTGMLASGRPVVAGALAGSALAAVVDDCGIVVTPEDGAAMAEAVRRLAGDQALRARLGQAGRCYAEREMDREAVLSCFERSLIILSLCV